jgi:hypothetical protein
LIKEKGAAMKHMIFFLGVVVATALAEDQTTQGTFQSPSRADKQVIESRMRPRANQIVTEKRVVSGAAVQLMKTDNPLQLINPFAPQEYGSGFDNLIADRDPITGNYSGIAIVSVSLEKPIRSRN